MPEVHSENGIAERYKNGHLMFPIITPTQEHKITAQRIKYHIALGDIGVALFVRCHYKVLTQ